MKPTAQKKTKKVTVKRKQKTLKISWKNLFQFFFMIPVVTIVVIEGSQVLVNQAEAANNNQQINFQGKIVNKTSGTNITDGAYSFTFKIYDASTAGNQLWTETQSSVTVTNGIFQVALGSVTSLTSLNFTNPNLWLDITFNGENFGSRIQLGAVPTAIDALNLDGVVATQSASGFNLAGGTSTVSTVSFTTSGSTLTMQPGNTGALTLQSNGANGLTLDTGGAAAINIGTTNANSITIGNNSSSNNTAVTLTTGGSGLLTLGSNTGVGNVVIQPNGGGNAALIVNKQADLGLVDPNIFVASSAGVLKFSVDEGGNATAAGSLSVGYPASAFTNAIGNFSGNVNNFLQVQVQNKNTGNAASTDFIATADNGTDTTQYIDLGINGSGYNQAAYNIGGANDGYLYTSNGALTIGTAANKPLIFHTNGTTSANEALRIDALGKVGSGTVGTNGPGNGQFVINQTNNSGLGDIFSASSSGATKFTIGNGGAITDLNYAGANAILYAAPTTGLVTTATTTTGSQCLLSQTGASGVPIWGSCSGGTTTLQQAYNAGNTINLSTNALILGNTPTGVGNVVINPDGGGAAALIINKQATSGDIFTASASGTTKFVLTNGGNVGIGSSTPQQALTLGSTGNFAAEMAVPTGATAAIATSGSLTNGNYFYKITASDGVGETIASTETSVCTSASNQHTCNVSWTGVANAVSYKIYRTSTSGSYTGTNFLTTVTTTSYSDTGAVTLTSGTPPTVTTAYATKLSPSGNSWLLGGNVGIGTTTPKATLHVEDGNNGGNAVAIFNQIGASTNDILAASASGTTKFIVHNDGSIQTVGGNATADVTTITGGNGLTVMPKANSAGAGGALVLKGGNGTGAAGGGLTLDAGTGSVNGTISIGTTNQSGLTLGRSGATTTINGSSLTLGAATGVSGALTITSNGTAALTVGANGSTNPVFQVDASTASVATGLKVLGAATGGTTAVSVIDSGTNASLSIDAKGSGTITIGGTSTGNIILGTTTNGLTFNDASGGPTYTGTARPTKKIVLSAEYPGAVLTASNSANITGSMTSDASPSAIPTSYNWQNYYQWAATSNTSPTLQDYTVAVRVTLPKDFSAWATGNCLTIAFNTPFTSNTLNALDVYMYQDSDTSGNPIAFRTGQASGTSKNWTTVNFTSSDFGGSKTWNTAGATAVIYLKLRSANTPNYVQVGDVTLNYLAAF